MKLTALALAFAAFATTAAAQPPSGFKSRPTETGYRLYLGEEVVLDLSDPGAFKVVDLRTAGPEILHETKPEKNTARFSFKQKTMPNGKAMVLSISSGLDYPLRYHARLVGRLPDGSEGTEATTTCPVRARLAMVEQWPFVLPAIEIADFSKAARGDKGCRN